MKKLAILFFLIFGAFVNGQDVGMWSAGSFGGPVSFGFPSGDDIYFSQGNKLHKGIEGAENIEIVSSSFLRDAATQIKINGDNLYAIYGLTSEKKNEITSTTLSNLGSSSSSQFSGIDNGINKFDEVDGFGLLAHNKDGLLNDKLVGKDLLGNTNDSFEYIRDFKDFAINGYIAYLIADDGTTEYTIEVIDFSAKSSAEKVGSIQVKHAQSLYYSNGYLFVACENGEGLKIIDVSTSTAPVLAGEYDANSFTQVIVDGSTAYLRKDNVLTILNVSDATNPTYVNAKTLDNISASVKFTDAKNDKIYYVDNGILGIIDATTLNISQKYLSALSSDWVASDNTTLVVYDKASYYFHSLEDVYNPKAYAVLAAEVEPVDFVISGTNFYVTANNKLYIYDTENLTSPSTEFAYFGEYSALKIANDFAVVGEYKYEGSTKFYYFEILDLTDKSNPTQLHLAEYPTVGTITSIEISLDNNTLYLSSELNGKVWLTIFDITNKSAPSRVHAGEIAEINSGKDTKLGIDGTELFVVTNYLTLNNYYAAKIFAYSVEESSNPRLISGLQITESEYNNVAFLEELLFVTIPSDSAIRLYSLDGDSTFRKEWTQVKTLDLDDEPANMTVFANKEITTSAIKGNSKFRETTGDYRTGTLYKSKKEKGTEITYIKLRPKVKVQLTTSVLPAEASIGGCSVSPSEGDYEKNEVVSITANAATGWVFDFWSNGLTGSANPSNLTMTTDKNVTANFKPILELGFNSIDAQNICPPTNTEKVYIGTTSLTTKAQGVDWQLTSLDYTITTKVKAEYAGVFIKYEGKTVQGTIHKHDNGDMIGLNFATPHLIPALTTLTLEIYFMFDFPPNEKGSLAPLDEIRKLGISIDRTQVTCDPINGIAGVKEPQDNFVSNIQTIGWIWNTSLTPYEPFKTIQDANDDPRTEDGHIIELCDGYYKLSGEGSTVKITKSLTVRPRGGSEDVYIEASNFDDHEGIFLIKADNVTLEGLNLQSKATSTFEGDTHTYVMRIDDGKNNITIKKNKINLNEGQIVIKGSSSNNMVITENLFERINIAENSYSRKVRTGIRLSKCNKPIIDKNKFNFMNYTILLEDGCSDGKIEENEFFDCKNDIVISESPKTDIYNNNINEDGELLAGYEDIILMSSDECKILNNIGITNSFEIITYQSDNCEVDGNYTKTSDLEIEINNSMNSMVLNNFVIKEDRHVLLNLIRSTTSGITNNVNLELNLVNGCYKDNTHINLIKSNSCSSINVENTRVKIIDNTIKDEGVKILNGIVSEIINNTILNSKNNGISIIDSDNIKILNNKIYDSEKHGIHTLNSNNIMIMDKNILSGNNGFAIILEGTKSKNSVYKVMGNTIYHNKEKAALVAINAGEVNFIANNIFSAYYAIHVLNVKSGRITANRFQNNGTAIKTVRSDSLLISRNLINYSWRNFTGIHLDNTFATIKDNNLTANNGAAIGMFNGSGAEIVGNNIYDNPDLAVFSDNPTTVVNVDENYWGGTEQPSSDIFEGNIELNSWLIEPLSLVVSAEKDSVITANSTTDSIYIAVENFVLDNDQAEITFVDEKGWLVNGGTHTLEITDSLVATYMLKFAVPSDAGSNFNNKVTISAVSLSNSEMAAVDSFYILNYTPELASIKVSPDSIAVGLGDSLQFRAYALDQYEKEFSGTTNYTWSVSAGTIDSTGYFRADSTQQVVTITVTETNSNISALAEINIQENTNVAEIVTIYPDSIVVPINGTIQFYAEGKDASGFNVVFNKYWISSGGPIDSTGFYTAGDIPGEYHVTVQDQFSGAEATATMIIAQPTDVEKERFIPKQYSLNQNYPNPFNPSTTISYALPFESKVKVEIFNVLGQRVDVIANGVESAGLHSTLWDAGHLASGIYIIRINATSISSNTNFTKSMKMLLIK